jgi:hypothetical protein
MTREMAENRRTKPHLPMREHPLRGNQGWLQPARHDRDHRNFFIQRGNMLFDIANLPARCCGNLAGF